MGTCEIPFGSAFPLKLFWKKLNSLLLCELPAQNLPNRIICVRIWLWERSLKSVSPFKHQYTGRRRWGSEGRNLQFLFASRDVPEIAIMQLWKAFYKEFCGACSDAELPLLPLQELRWGWAHWVWGTDSPGQGQALPLCVPLWQLWGGQPKAAPLNTASRAPGLVPRADDGVPGTGMGRGAVVKCKFQLSGNVRALWGAEALSAGSTSQGTAAPRASIWHPPFRGMGFLLGYGGFVMFWFSFFLISSSIKKRKCCSIGNNYLQEELSLYCSVYNRFWCRGFWDSFAIILSLGEAFNFPSYVVLQHLGTKSCDLGLVSRSLDPKSDKCNERNPSQSWGELERWETAGSMESGEDFGGIIF